MKYSQFLILFLVLTLLFTSCSRKMIDETDDSIDTDIIEWSEYEEADITIKSENQDMFDTTVDVETEMYTQALEDKYDIYDYEDMIFYYEIMCEELGYQTYESVYHPEIWRYYHNYDDTYYHEDWLCPEFDHEPDYFVAATPQTNDGYLACPSCHGTVFYYLNENDKIFHSSRDHLDLGTDDYITIRVNYRFVGYENAVDNGFTPCQTCRFE